ncbi:hypothetical protein [Micromonospora sp. NPDC048169]|uniref:hypothetical protein n=1 Tax=unclassified Micromonospora TaxID=2617518 RepID=UPI0033CB42F0
MIRYNLNNLERSVMRFSRLGVRLVTVITAALTLGAVTAAPTVAAAPAAPAAVAAADDGAWRAYGNTNPITSSPSTWSCGSTETITTNVIAQACAIRTVNGDRVQGAVIVRNNRSTLASVSAWTTVYQFNGSLLGEWKCPYSGVAANSWSVCFGVTRTWSSSVFAGGAALGLELGTSSLV